MENLLIGSARHLELSGGLREVDYLMLNLPYVCNYKCTKCCNDRGKVTDNNSLSLDEIIGLLKEATYFGICVLAIAGEGEPFLDPRIKEIIQEAYLHSLIPYIFTNGSRLDNDITQFLKEDGASLVINLDSLDEKLYDELNGVRGSFRKAYDNIQRIREQFKDTYSQIENYGLRRIAINTVISHKNRGELARIKNFCGDDFAFVCNTPMNIGRATENSQFLGVVPDLDTIPLGTTSDGCWCAYMRNGISVGANGDFLICAYSLESSGKLGNVRDEGLRQYIGQANKAVDNFYAKKTHSRCILRHPHYQEFITGLEDKHD